MHDATKLLFAKKFRLKIDKEVHVTTIKDLRELIKNKKLLDLIEKGYKEFLNLATDLSEAKKERVKSQYTGTTFMKEQFRKNAKEFLNEIAEPYIKKIEILMGEKND